MLLDTIFDKGIQCYHCCCEFDPENDVQKQFHHYRSPFRYILHGSCKILLWRPKCITILSVSTGERPPSVRCHIFDLLAPIVYHTDTVVVNIAGGKIGRILSGMREEGRAQRFFHFFEKLCQKGLTKGGWCGIINESSERDGAKPKGFEKTSKKF